MGPIILAMLFPFILVFFVLYANKHQKKSKEAFEKICQEQGQSYAPHLAPNNMDIQSNFGAWESTVDVFQKQ